MKKYRDYCLAMLVLLLFSSMVRANNPVLLPNASFDYSITPYVSVLEDPTGQLDITTMLTREQQLRFTPSHARSLKFGVTDSVYWLRFSLTNPYANQKQIVLTLSGNELDDIEFYDISAGDNYAVIRKDHHSRSLRGSFIQAHPIELHIPAQSTRSYLVRVHSDGIFSTHIRLMSVDRFVANEQKVFTVQGISIGWVMATLAWFLFIFYRDRPAFALVSACYCATIAVFQPSWLGFMPLLTELSSETANIIAELALVCSAVAKTLAIRFVGWQGPKERLINLYLYALAAIHLPLMLLSIYWAPESSMLVAALLVVLNEFAVLPVLALARARYEGAQRWLLTGTIAIGFSVLIAILTTYNYLSMDALTDWAPLILPFIVIATLVLSQMDMANPAVREEKENKAQGLLSPALLSQISHELRTPINGVIGMNELLNETPLSASQRDFSDTIALAGRDLLHVANEISDLSRIRKGMLELENRPFDLSVLLNEVMSHFQQEAIRKQVELVIDFADELPERFNGDASRLQTILHNLVDHALAYTEYGELTLHAGSYQSGDKTGIRLQLQMSNTMVKQDELKQAFSVLHYQRPLPEVIDNLPWDLIVTRHLMEKLRATLAVESMTGHGASLTLCLPIDAAEVPEAEINDDSLIGLRILIVDDNASLRTVIEKQVRRWGMRPESTYSGKEALAMMRNQISMGQPYDILIIDHDMPVMNGLQLAERIQQDKDIDHKPALLMLTGMNVTVVREDALAVGIQQLLAKPASGDRLRQALQGLRFRRQSSMA
ncbi:7TM-DISM domain-containing protein [Thalassolituus marinus]|uniref:histidine kinase n=1 Tax=Thalassolituus marinus TaxID=671053 RepID=A0ABS7ZYF8_9GAMM|nr:7TM-DISM domain-containing protein [Thalassolituus marinus]MCA6065491.1 response regulator [Thalassolituus marinus]